MKLSIIIPMYNTSEWCEPLIKKLTIQQNTYKETEIILIDDGSTEDISWVKRYKNIIFKQNNHRGVSAARNAGLDKATGDVISFIDSDDSVSDDYIKTILESIGDADYLTFRYQAINGHTIRFIGMFHVWAVWGYAFKRSLIGDTRFDENLMYGEDIDWLRKIIDCNTSNARTMKKIYQYNYMVNPDSINSRLFNNKPII